MFGKTTQVLKELLILALYVSFGFFYWIEGHFYLSALSLIFAASLALLLHQFNKYLILTLILGLTHLALPFVYLIPYAKWPFDFIFLAVLGFLVCQFLFKKNLSLKWSLKFSKPEVLSIAIINVPAVFVLAIYFHYNKALALSFPLPSVPIWSLPLVVITGALINGFREELYYRGLLQSLSQESLRPWAVVLLQAFFFGILHFQNAFPQGWIGVGLTSLWGGLIAIQYQVFRSMALAWVTHAVADAVMFSIIILNRWEF
jgi:membrane protease YdiL (CAAX protease family)